MKENENCFYCEQEFDGSKLLSSKTIDHAYPLSKGGAVRGRNLIDCCYECNHVKGDLLIPDFIELLKHSLKTGSGKGCGISKNRRSLIIKNATVLGEKIDKEIKKYTRRVTHKGLSSVWKIHEEVFSASKEFIDRINSEPEPNFHYEDSPAQPKDMNTEKMPELFVKRNKTELPKESGYYMAVGLNLLPYLIYFSAQDGKWFSEQHMLYEVSLAGSGSWLEPITVEQFITEYPQIVEKIRKEAFIEGAVAGFQPITIAGTLYIDRLAKEYIDSLKQK